MSVTFLSAPALRLDLTVTMTKFELELISDADMYLFFKKVIRGGVSYISKRCIKASNKYLKSYDPIQDPKHIILLHANNLYDYAISNFPGV